MGWKIARLQLPKEAGAAMAALQGAEAPAAPLMRARACAFIALVRNQSDSISDGAPLMQATLVSLSRKTSFR